MSSIICFHDGLVTLCFRNSNKLHILWQGLFYFLYILFDIHCFLQNLLLIIFFFLSIFFFVCCFLHNLLFIIFFFNIRKSLFCFATYVLYSLFLVAWYVLHRLHFLFLLLSLATIRAPLYIRPSLP